MFENEREESDRFERGEKRRRMCANVFDLFRLVFQMGKKSEVGLGLCDLGQR